MTKTQLVEEIECYASAKASGNVTLTQRQAYALKQVFDALPEDLGVPADKPADKPAEEPAL